MQLNNILLNFRSRPLKNIFNKQRIVAAKNQVVHLIPYDAIGGVETAAKSLDDGCYGDINFSKFYLADKTNSRAPSSYFSENDPRAYFRALKYLWVKNPDVLVASLWRSCIVSIVVKILKPRIRLVTFLHLPSDVHFFDWLFNRLAMILSDEIWADSMSTLNSRVPKSLTNKGRSISFLVHRISPPRSTKIRPVFAFWGRLHSQKGLTRALRFFADICEYHPKAVYHIIGPDGGERKALEIEILRLGLNGSVHFHGPKTQRDIFLLAADCSFYLQTSENEGMAMSVVEAMQLGLVPIVAPVGEIAHYCKHENNAFVLESNGASVIEALKNLDNDNLFQAMRSAAVSTWSHQVLYSESVIEACEKIIAKGR
jgi:glycosyltransferase involved in cell wall biosynthesis